VILSKIYSGKHVFLIFVYMSGMMISLIWLWHLERPGYVLIASDIYM
jgi:hypothetical protein